MVARRQLAVHVSSSHLDRSGSQHSSHSLQLLLAYCNGCIRFHPNTISCAFLLCNGVYIILSHSAVVHQSHSLQEFTKANTHFQGPTSIKAAMQMSQFVVASILGALSFSSEALAARSLHQNFPTHFPDGTPIPFNFPGVPKPPPPPPSDPPAESPADTTEGTSISCFFNSFLLPGMGYHMLAFYRTIQKFLI